MTQHAGPDHLAPLPEQRVAAWYGRLVEMTARQKVQGRTPLTAELLGHYLTNRDPSATYDLVEPDYLKNRPQVGAALLFHRAVFLTEQKARQPNGAQGWAGALPRLQGLPGFTRWNGATQLRMHYESLVEIGGTALEVIRIQTRGSPEERDLFGSLRGFQLRSEVLVQGRPANGKVTISFTNWTAQVLDRYDFDYSKFLTTPNPDFGSRAADAVRPQDRTLLVYHSNARRLERARLAAPFNVRGKGWVVAAPSITGPAEVDPSRSLR